MKFILIAFGLIPVVIGGISLTVGRNPTSGIKYVVNHERRYNHPLAIDDEENEYNFENTEKTSVYDSKFVSNKVLYPNYNEKNTQVYYSPYTSTINSKVETSQIIDKNTPSNLYNGRDTNGRIEFKRPTSIQYNTPDISKVQINSINGVNTEANVLKERMQKPSNEEYYNNYYTQYYNTYPAAQNVDHTYKVASYQLKPSKPYGSEVNVAIPSIGRVTLEENIKTPNAVVSAPNTKNYNEMDWFYKTYGKMPPLKSELGINSYNLEANAETVPQDFIVANGRKSATSLGKSAKSLGKSATSLGKSATSLGKSATSLGKSAASLGDIVIDALG